MSQPILNRKLVLEAPVRLPDGAGGYTQGWDVLGTHWAAVVAGTGREVAGVATSLSRVSYRITLRAAQVGSTARPLPDQRFREGMRIFKVLAVGEADPGGRYLSCLAEEEAAV